MDDIMEVVYWIELFLAPFLPLSIIGVIIYFNNTNYGWLSIVLMITGGVLGILLAERIRKKYGTATYIGRIRGNSEFMNEEKPKDEEGSE